jgi:cytochrome o ubiquinol oxidase subunit 3
MSAVIPHPMAPPAAVELHDDAHAHDAGATTVLGFWIYLMSDCLLFASLFAAYAVLHGMAMLAMNRRQAGAVLTWLGATFLFGLGFMGMEVNEFHRLLAEGHGPDRSAFLSSFFTLVGTHGLHVAAGLLWMAVMAVQVVSKGLGETVRTRLLCLSLFWHFLDIVWICVFSVVYLAGKV